MHRCFLRAMKGVAMVGYTKNRMPFTEICHGSFGRKIIFSNVIEITKENIVSELNKALVTHWKNREEIDYLDRYYTGDQPILYRIKKVRPEVNNKAVENHAFEIVEHKTSELHGEPIQLVLKGTDEAKTQSMKDMNDYNGLADKNSCDIELGRWRSICGTSYRYIKKNDDCNKYDDESPYSLFSENPKDTFIAYSSKTKRALFSCQCRKDEKDEPYYFIYTRNQTFKIKNSKVIKNGLNGYFIIPVVEYPNNDRRLSDIEIVITLLDCINKMQSDRMNGIEQFVQSLMKFKNVEVDNEKAKEIQNLGGVSFKVQQGMDGDITLMTSELNQEQSQVAKEDLWANVLNIEGMPSRESNTGGDTGQAVYLRNGWDFSENRAELSEQIYKKSEKQSLKVQLNILRTLQLTNLELKDIEIKITRSKMDNMMVKATVAQILLKSGYNPKIVTKIINLFPDPEDAYKESEPYLKALYKTAKEIAKEVEAENARNERNQVSDLPKNVV